MIDTPHVNAKYVPNVRFTYNKVTETGNVHCLRHTLRSSVHVYNVVVKLIP
jgi:hypothetical protein